MSAISDVFTCQVAFGNIEVKYTIIHTAPSVYYYRTYNDFAKMPKMALNKALRGIELLTKRKKA